MIKVIVVEDEYLLRTGLIRSMPWRECGCEVIGEADNAGEGIRLAETLKPDIVITDIRLPGMDGLEMIAAIKAKLDCEFIILSGYSHFEYVRQAVALGARGYLLKPVDDDEFMATLEEAAEMVHHKRQFSRLLRQYENHAGNRPEAGELRLPMKPVRVTDNNLAAAIDYIRDHCAENISCSVVADQLHISVSTLSKLFKTSTGYTFLEFLTLHRIRRSMDLLEQTDLKTYQIAGQVGYQDARYFSDIFKRIVGMTPTQYRNQ